MLITFFPLASSLTHTLTATPLAQKITVRFTNAMILPNKHLCLYDKIKYQLKEAGQFISFSVQSIPIQHKSLVVASNQPQINFLAVTPINSSSLEFTQSLHLQKYVLTNQQSIYNLKNGSYVSPSCKNVFQGQRLTWTFLEIAYQVWSCPTQLLNSSERQIRQALEKCVKSKQTNSIYLNRYILLSLFVSALFL